MSSSEEILKYLVIDQGLHNKLCNKKIHLLDKTIWDYKEKLVIVEQISREFNRKITEFNL